MMKITSKHIIVGLGLVVLSGTVVWLSQNKTAKQPIFTEEPEQEMDQITPSSSVPVGSLEFVESQITGRVNTELKANLVLISQGPQVIDGVDVVLKFDTTKIKARVSKSTDQLKLVRQLSQDNKSIMSWTAETNGYQLDQKLVVAELEFVASQPGSYPVIIMYAQDAKADSSTVVLTGSSKRLPITTNSLVILINQ